MIMTLLIQFKIIFFSLIAGMLTGLLFDNYRIFRGFNTHKIVLIIEDLLFWTLCALIIFIFLLYTNYAFMGFYVYLYITLGVLIYLKFISHAFIKIQSSIVKSIIKFIRILFNFITYPIKIIFYKGKK